MMRSVMLAVIKQLNLISKRRFGLSMDSEEFKISPVKKIILKDYDPNRVPKWAKKQEDKEGKKSSKRTSTNSS